MMQLQTTPPPDSIVYHLHNLSNELSTISNNTAHTFDWSWWEGFVEIMTILGVVFAAFGIGYIFINIRQRHISNERKRLIFQDFVRHLFVNTAIIEIIRLNVEQNGGYGECYPEEGVLERMKFLPEDLRLSRFRTSDRYFDEMHDLELLMRNYGVAADVTNRHLCDSSIDAKTKQDDLLEVQHRGIALIGKIYSLSTRLNLSPEPVVKIIEDKYGDRLNEISSTDKVEMPTLPEKNPAEWSNEGELKTLYIKYVNMRRQEGYVRTIKF